MGSLVPYRVDLFDDEIDSHPHLRPRQPAQPVPGARGAPVAGARVPDGREAARGVPRALARTASEGDPPRAASTRTWATASPPRASSTTCRCSLSKPRPCSTTSGANATLVLHGDWNRRSSASGKTRASATASCSTTPSAHPCRPRPCSSTPEEFYTTPKPTPNWPCARDKTSNTAPGPALPDLGAQRGADDPLAKLQRPFRGPAGRPGAAAGRKRRSAREPAGACCVTTGVHPPGVQHARRLPSQRPTRSASRPPPLAGGFTWTRARQRPFVTETELFASAPDHAPPPQARAGQRCRCAHQGPERAERGRPGGAQPARHWPLPGPDQHGHGRQPEAPRAAGVPAPGIRRQGHALRAGQPTAPDQPLHRRERRRGAAAPAGLAASGRKPSARPPNRCATPPPSCSTSTPAAPPARAIAFRYSPHDYDSLRQRLRLRGNRRPEGRHPRGHPGHDQPAADGPAGLRRRGLWQDRGRPARGLCGRHRRQAGGAFWRPPPCWPSSTTRPCVDRFAKWPVQGRRDEPLSHRPRKSTPPSRAWPTARSTSWSARTSC